MKRQISVEEARDVPRFLSMTPAERDNPELLNSSRKKRVAAGCGLQVVDINGETLTITSILGAVGIFLASINIFGGFLVTQRMLDMFKKKK